MLIFKSNNLNDKKILFIHIPKAAGQSILHIIRFEIFHDTHPKWLYIGNPIEADLFEIISGDDLARHDFLGGHVSLELFKNKLGDRFFDFFSFSILRNPTDKAISLYSYILSNPDHFQHAEVKGMSLTDFIYSAIYPRNHQCHLFLQNSTATEAIDFIRKNICALGFFDDLKSISVLLGNKFGITPCDIPSINITPLRLEYINYSEIFKAISIIDSEDMMLFNYFNKLRGTNAT